jgi:hypothetical protein
MKVSARLIQLESARREPAAGRLFWPPAMILRRNAGRSYEDSMADFIFSGGGVTGALTGCA